SVVMRSRRPARWDGVVWSVGGVTTADETAPGHWSAGCDCRVVFAADQWCSPHASLACSWTTRPQGALGQGQEASMVGAMPGKDRRMWWVVMGSPGLGPPRSRGRPARGSGAGGGVQVAPPGAAVPVRAVVSGVEFAAADHQAVRQLHEGRADLGGVA